MSKRKASTKRRQHLRNELESLKVRTGWAGQDRYQLRLAQVLASWTQEMRYRAETLSAPMVWSFVEQIELDMGKEYAKMAADIATAELEKVMRPSRLPVSANV